MCNQIFGHFLILKDQTKFLQKFFHPLISKDLINQILQNLQKNSDRERRFNCIPIFLGDTTPYLRHYYTVLFFNYTWITQKLRRVESEQKRTSNSKTTEYDAVCPGKPLNIVILCSFFCQALIPLVTTVVPRIISASATYLQIPSEREIDLAALMSPWFPILNFLSTIVFIQPYRHYALQLLPFTTTNVMVSQSRNNYPN
jgi:hypothetical protein